MNKTSRFQIYNYNGTSYTLDTVNWQMTEFDEESGEEFLANAQTVAEVLTNGSKVS